MENSSKNKKFIFSLIGIMLLILFSVGMVYAFFNYTKTGQRNNVLNTANLTFYFEDSEWIWLENAYPMTTEEALTLETTGNSDVTEVDGGIAQFKVVGGYASGAIHYQISLIKEDLTTTTTSHHGTYSLDPSTKIGQLPDGAVSINLQTSTSDIFETVGLVNDISNLERAGKSFEQAYTDSYVNASHGVSIDKLPQGMAQNERIIGTGIMSGETATRYFELRMWINDTVLMNDELSTACLSSTSNSDITAHGRGYCNPSTPNLPAGIKYVYSSGEFAKLYYSNKIKVETTEVSAGVIKPEPPEIVKTLIVDNTVLHDSQFTNLYDNVSQTADTGLLLMDSTANDDYPIYYYRGAVNNNNVIFGGFCWKIVRTTETGGTKLIYNGTPNNGKCTATGADTHIVSTQFNNNLYSVAYVGYKYGSVHPSAGSRIISGESANLGTGVSWNGTQYTLTGQTGSQVIGDTIRYNHYSCWNDTGICSSPSYVIHANGLGTVWYFNVENGQTHLDLLNATLSNDGSVASNAYTKINEWFENYLLDNSYEYIEDTVFCNDRSIFDYGMWDINKTSGPLYFNGYDRLQNNKNPSLTCQNLGDRFTVSSSNGNGQLDYPVGLLTADELVLAGAKWETANSSFYLWNGDYQWTMSPIAVSYEGAAFMFYLNDDGILTFYYVNDSDGEGLRPVISLNKDTYFESGDGTSNNPYVVHLDPT